jgi:hypothetical protein
MHAICRQWLVLAALCLGVTWLTAQAADEPAKKDDKASTDKKAEDWTKVNKYSELPEAVRKAIGKALSVLPQPSKYEKGTQDGKDAYRVTWPKVVKIYDADGKELSSTATTDATAAAPPMDKSKTPEKKAPAKSDGKGVSFAKDIKPILAANCLMCHDKAKHKGGFDLQTSHKTVMETVEASKPEESVMFKSITGDGAKQMPPKGKLSAKDVETIKKWIADGAKDN